MIESKSFSQAVRYGTPSYVYQLDDIRLRIGDLRSALPDKARIFYSLKANPLPQLASEIQKAGCSIEVSSAGELDRSLSAGFDPADIMYTGPGKSNLELASALKAGVRMFSSESAGEVRRLGHLTHPDSTVDVILRLKPDGHANSGLSMSNDSQFGFTPEEAIEAWPALSSTGSVHLSGWHVYYGSQLADATALLAGFVNAKDVIETVCLATNTPTGVVNLGGGFPWPYATNGIGADLQGLKVSLDSMHGTWQTAPTELWFESGRRIVASSGTLLTTVIEIKSRRNSFTIVADGGINVLGGMAGLGRVLRPRMGFQNLTASNEDDRVIADIVGPLCTPLDRLSTGVDIARPKIGDVLAVSNVGAYGLSASLTSFLSRPAPNQLVFDGDDLVGAWTSTTHDIEIDLPIK